VSTFFFLGKFWRPFIVHVISTKFGFFKKKSSFFYLTKLKKKILVDDTFMDNVHVFKFLVIFQ